ncbi:hypothetical protein KY289_030574 [Solanum tuberosum]|nr:hypothetical protein KY289_030574 [Solanum tuberosum]
MRACKPPARQCSSSSRRRQPARRAAAPASISHQQTSSSDWRPAAPVAATTSGQRLNASVPLLFSGENSRPPATPTTSNQQRHQSPVKINLDRSVRFIDFSLFHSLNRFCFSV